MFSLDDTIVAIATPHGRGGIGVIRISGRRAVVVAESVLAPGVRLRPRHATFTRLASRRAATASGDNRRSLRRHQPVDVDDEVIATLFPSPQSYTGEDVIEISAHGSPVVLRGIVERGVEAGARLAEPGEFTLRAFLNGKRNLVQAEAVADLIDAVTPLQARTAFDQLQGTLTERIRSIDNVLYDLIARLEASIDFPDEGYHFIEARTLATDVGTVCDQIDSLLVDAECGRMIRDGAHVVIAGRPNVGKSSLFNAIAGADRAIVTDVPGTTRDLITERVDIGGVSVTLVDTAGARDTLDIVEREGVARGDRARNVADLVLVVLDATEPLNADDCRLLEGTAHAPRLVVLSKCDLVDVANETLPGVDAVPLRVSAVTSAGIDDLKAAIVGALTHREFLRDSPPISNTRHIGLMRAARADLDSARTAAVAEMPEEFVLADLQSARQRFDEIVGRRTTDDLLEHIFRRFCIGK